MYSTYLARFVQVINYSESRTAEDICEQSSKLITFIDLAGHHKYLRTTIFGLTGHSPDFAMLVIAANAGIGKDACVPLIYICLPKNNICLLGFLKVLT